MNPIKSYFRNRTERKLMVKGMLAGIVPVYPDMTDETKTKIMSDAGEGAGKILLTAWFMCGLGKKFTCTLYNEGTDEWFRLEMKKIDPNNLKP